MAGIARYPNTKSPTVCTSSTRPASPYEGQHIYETDTDLRYVWNGTLWVSAFPVTISASAPTGGNNGDIWLVTY